MDENRQDVFTLEEYMKENPDQEDDQNEIPEETELFSLLQPLDGVTTEIPADHQQMQDQKPRSDDQTFFGRELPDLSLSYVLFNFKNTVLDHLLCFDPTFEELQDDPDAKLLLNSILEVRDPYYKAFTDAERGGELREPLVEMVWNLPIYSKWGIDFDAATLELLDEVVIKAQQKIQKRKVVTFQPYSAKYPKMRIPKTKDVTGLMDYRTYENRQKGTPIDFSLTGKSSQVEAISRWIFSPEFAEEYEIAGDPIVTSFDLIVMCACHYCVVYLGLHYVTYNYFWKDILGHPKNPTKADIQKLEECFIKYNKSPVVRRILVKDKKDKSAPFQDWNIGSPYIVKEKEREYIGPKGFNLLQVTEWGVQIEHNGQPTLGFFIAKGSPLVEMAESRGQVFGISLEQFQDRDEAIGRKNGTIPQRLKFYCLQQIHYEKKGPKNLLSTMFKALGIKRNRKRVAEVQLDRVLYKLKQDGILEGFEIDYKNDAFYMYPKRRKKRKSGTSQTAPEKGNAQDTPKSK